MNKVKLFLAPHADVRFICGELYKMQTGLEGLGLKADALEEATRMLTIQSIEIDEWRSGKRKPVEGE